MIIVKATKLVIIIIRILAVISNIVVMYKPMVGNFFLKNNRIGGERKNKTKMVYGPIPNRIKFKAKILVINVFKVWKKARKSNETKINSL